MDDYPRVLRVDASQSPQISATVVVPPRLSGLPLPESAFQVTEGKRSHPVTAAVPLPATDLRLVIVVDPTVTPELLVAQQGAARELLIRLPPAVRAGVVATGPKSAVVAPLSTDRAQTIGAILGLVQRPGSRVGDITPALTLALRQLQPPASGDAVIAVDGRPVTQLLPDALSKAAAASRATIYAFTFAKAPVGYLSGLPAVTGGRVVQVAGDRLLGALDTAVDVLSSRYRVDFSSPGQSSHVVELSVAAYGTRGVTSFIVEPPPPAKVGRNGRSRPSWYLLALVVLVPLLSFVLRRRAGRRA